MKCLLLAGWGALSRYIGIYNLAVHMNKFMLSIAVEIEAIVKYNMFKP